MSSDESGDDREQALDDEIDDVSLYTTAFFLGYEVSSSCLGSLI